MKKKKKFNLEIIKVKSFVTSLNNGEKNRINAGNAAAPTEPDDTCGPATAGTTCPGSGAVSICACETLECPSYICEEFRTDLCG